MILSTANTLLEDIVAAKEAGYTSDFMYQDNKILCRENNIWYTAQELVLVEYCRHEGMNDPGDSSILFLIEASDTTKGCLSSAYGKDADSGLIEFVLSLPKKK
ncbi:phosphoribosylpyrophosphate synthetase [Dokdonia sinensis]|nr:phosphoribosylpyrophosphate synthetase [Dokdonia sinensis]